MKTIVDPTIYMVIIIDIRYQITKFHMGLIIINIQFLPSDFSYGDLNKAPAPFAPKRYLRYSRDAF
jgi:hypothetical protein